MALVPQTFTSIRELQLFVAAQGIPRGQIVAVVPSLSGSVDLLYDNASLGYSAGVGAGTVTVPEGAALLGIRCTASGGASSVVIDGGDLIVVPSGTTFAQDFDGRRAGGFDVVLGANASYVVSWLL